MFYYKKIIGQMFTSAVRYF